MLRASRGENKEMPGERGDQGGAGVGLFPRVTWCKSVWTCSPRNTAPCGARLVTLTDTKTTECVGFAASQPCNIPRAFDWQGLPGAFSPFPGDTHQRWSSDRLGNGIMECPVNPAQPCSGQGQPSHPWDMPPAVANITTLAGL